MAGLSLPLCPLRFMSDTGQQIIALRPVHESDLDLLFDQIRDPDAVWTAEFTPDDPDDRQRFDAHLSRVLTSPEGTLRAVTRNGDPVGSIASFVLDGQTGVTYWIDRAVGGRASPAEPLSCSSR